MDYYNDIHVEQMNDEDGNSVTVASQFIPNKRQYNRFRDRKNKKVYEDEIDANSNY